MCTRVLGNPYMCLWILFIVVTMQVNRWLLASLLLFMLIETVGLIFWNTFAGAVAAFSLLFGFFFFGFFFLAYIGSAFQALVNPWVSRVERMEGPCFNPMYVAWLFENDRREWAAYTTLVDSLFTPLFGIILFYLFTGGEVSFENSFIGFLISCTFLAVLALSWYKGFWKPRTRKSPERVPDSIEAKWRDKRL